MIVEAPRSRGVGPEAAPGMAGVATGPGAHIQDADLEHVAGLGPLDGHGPCQQMHAQALAGTAQEGTLDRPGAASRHRLMLARPVEHALRPWVIRDHALVVVVRVMGQRLDRGAVAGPHRQRRGDHRAEVSPVHGGWRNGEVVMLHPFPTPGVHLPIPCLASLSSGSMIKSGDGDEAWRPLLTISSRSGLRRDELAHGGDGGVPARGASGGAGGAPAAPTGRAGRLAVTGAPAGSRGRPAWREGRRGC